MRLELLQNEILTFFAFLIGTMLFLFTYWLYLLVTCSLLGFTLSHHFEIKSALVGFDLWIVSFWLGILTFTFTLFTLAYWFAITPQYLVLLGGLAILSLISLPVRTQAKEWLFALKEHRQQTFGMVGIILATAYYLSHSSIVWLDSGLYI